MAEVVDGMVALAAVEWMSWLSDNFLKFPPMHPAPESAGVPKSQEGGHPAWRTSVIRRQVAADNTTARATLT